MFLGNFGDLYNSNTTLVKVKSKYSSVGKDYQHYSNTTLVKVKCYTAIFLAITILNSNTTLVKVKLVPK